MASRGHEGELTLGELEPLFARAGLLEPLCASPAWPVAAQTLEALRLQARGPMSALLQLRQLQLQRPSAALGKLVLALLADPDVRPLVDSAAALATLQRRLDNEPTARLVQVQACALQVHLADATAQDGGKRPACVWMALEGL